MISLSEIEHSIHTYDADLFKYIQYHNLVKNNNVFFLSGKHFYFYDKKDMRGIKTVIHLKKLNNVKYLDNTIKQLHGTLSKKTILCGRFVHCKPIRGMSNSIRFAKLYEVVMNLLDNNTNRYLTKRMVTSYLGAYNFKILDMTEIEGITYFHAKKL